MVLAGGRAKCWLITTPSAPAITARPLRPIGGRRFSTASSIPSITA